MCNVCDCEKSDCGDEHEQEKHGHNDKQTNNGHNHKHDSHGHSHSLESPKKVPEETLSMKTDSDFDTKEFDFIDETKAGKRERKFEYKEVYNNQVELFKAMARQDKAFLLSKIKNRIEDMASVYTAMTKPFSRRTPEDLEQISQSI
jgi:hypothetical protein